MTAVGILDIDDAEAMGMVTAYNAPVGGDVLAQSEMQALGDNSYQEVPLVASCVRRLEVWSPSSGAVAVPSPVVSVSRKT